MTAVRVVLTFLAATALWLRWAPVDLFQAPLYGRVSALLGGVIVAVFAAVVFIWSAVDAARYRRESPRSPLWPLIWVAAALATWAILGALFMIPLNAWMSGKPRPTGHMAYDIGSVVVVLLAFFVAIPVTALCVPLIAWVTSRTPAKARVAVADASVACLGLLLVVYLARASWVPRPYVSPRQSPPRQTVWTPEASLKAAAFSGNWNDVRARIEAGERDTEGAVLFAACTRNDPQFVRKLIDGGSPVNARQGSLTPLLYLAQVPETEARLSMAQMLIKAGADVNVADEREISALDHAMARKNEKLIEMLRRAGARNGATPEASPDSARR